ncbi:MAG: interleukin-like EMT inducer domain-containing protein, partial [Candidatus Omnitrophota bacterium]
MKKSALFLLFGLFAVLPNIVFGEDVTPPQILELEYSGRYYVNQWVHPGVDISFKTDEPAKTKCWVLMDGVFVLGANPPSFDIEHDLFFYYLPKTIINFYLECEDQSGNKTTSPIYEISNYPYLRGNLNINNGAHLTNSRNVTLKLQACDPEFTVSQICFSNDGQNWTSWENYISEKIWQLSEGEGLKTVYAKLKNSAGLYTMTPLSDSIYFTTQLQPSGPTTVRVNGNQLLVQKIGEGPFPYKIKGVCWSPASIGNPGYENISAREAEFNSWYMQDIALMKDMGINTVRTYLDFGQNTQTFNTILDELYNNGIMVIMAIDDCVADLPNLERVVSNFKNHPAILAWQIGNEWNLNGYYVGLSGEPGIVFTEQAAQKVKQLDPYHPVMSILGDSGNFVIPVLGEENGGNVIEYFVSKRCPSVDIWGFNIYRGGSFGGLFYEWSQISQKPMFISEAGTDSFDNRIVNENPQMQADFNSGLFNDMYFHFSADRSDEPCLGITFFEWNDEWWKYYDAWNHNSGGYNMPYSHPDDYADEEYFGLVDINRTKRQAYFSLRDNYEKQGQLINLPSSVIVKAVSGSSVHFFLNNQRFHYRGGGGGGGRGFNFAIIDPKTGLVEEVRNFDSWADHNALLYAINFINTIPDGKIIMIAIADEGGLTYISTFREVFYQAMESLGSQLIRNVGYWDDWAMISIKGEPGNLGEAHNPSGQGINSVTIEANV